MARKKTHEEKTQYLQDKILSCNSPLALGGKAPSNTMRSGEYKAGALRLDLSSFNSVLEINTKERWVDVEPRVTMEKLCKATLKEGFLPPVVPEFKTITVGGAIMGGAIESSSHRFGQFNDTALFYDLVLGDGKKIRCSSLEHSDLFYALPGSYGSLALLTKARLPLIKVPAYVHLFCRRFSDIDALTKHLTSENGADFLEGIWLGPSWGVAIEGRFTQKKPSLPRARFSRPWDKWFYHYISDESAKGDFECVVPLYDYLFRYDRGAFWMGRLVMKPSILLKLLLNRPPSYLLQHKESARTNPSLLFRTLFSWALSSTKLYRLWHKIPKSISEKLLFVQDFYAPPEKATAVITHFQKETGIWPLWLCPLKGSETPQFLCPHGGRPRFLNMGIYGLPQTKRPIPELTASFEKEIREFGGWKMLYALTYYTEEEFSKIYDGERYRQLRHRYNAEKAFLPLYKKVRGVV